MPWGGGMPVRAGHRIVTTPAVSRSRW
jgi:hypothetical protein